MLIGKDKGASTITIIMNSKLQKQEPGALDQQEEQKMIKKQSLKMVHPESSVFQASTKNRKDTHL